MKRAIAYYRVSTGEQEKSGLGMEAQQKAVADFAVANDFELIYEFCDVNSGRRNDRIGLKEALKECRRQKVTLIIARLDRLSRSVAFIAMLMESNADFRIVNNPYADRFTIHILAAVAEKERQDTVERTKAALAAAKMRGTQLGLHGKYVLSKLNKRSADRFARKMKPLIRKLREQGIRSMRAIAAALNRMKVPTYSGNGHKWHHNTIQNLLKRLNRL